MAGAIFDVATVSSVCLRVISDRIFSQANTFSKSFFHLQKPCSGRKKLTAHRTSLDISCWRYRYGSCFRRDE